MGGRPVLKVIPLTEKAVGHLRSAYAPSHQKEVI